jgi:hypothetical protein
LIILRPAAVFRLCLEFFPPLREGIAAERCPMEG